MKEIQLTRGKVALVDDADYEWLNQFNWYASSHEGRWYAYRKTTRAERKTGKPTAISMQRQIMAPPKGFEIDHKNHNELNCQRFNMRICTTQQNNWNRKGYINVSSKYKGVHWHKKASKWTSQIHFNEKTKHLGLFVSEIEAAQAYNKAAKEAFGRFAYLNPILNKRKEICNGKRKCGD